MLPYASFQCLFVLVYVLALTFFCHRCAPVEPCKAAGYASNIICHSDVPTTLSGSHRRSHPSVSDISKRILMKGLHQGRRMALAVPLRVTFD